MNEDQTKPEGKQINKEYVIQALTTQVANHSLVGAQNHAIIIELEEENTKLKKEIEELQEARINELDDQAKDIPKNKK